MNPDLLVLVEAWESGDLQALHLEHRKGGVVHVRAMMPKRPDDERQPGFTLSTAPEHEGLRVAALTTRVMIAEEEVPHAK